MADDEVFEASGKMVSVVGDVVADRRVSLEVEEHTLDGGDGIMALGSMTGVASPDMFKKENEGDDMKLVMMEHDNNNGAGK